MSVSGDGVGACKERHAPLDFLNLIFGGLLMAYNNYANSYANNYTNPYGYNMYAGNAYQQNMMQQQQPQQMGMLPPQQNQYDVPIQGVIFLTSDEAKAYIVPPNKRVMIMDRDKSVFYIKSADALGQSNTAVYKFEPLVDETPKMEIETKAINTEEFVKKNDIKEFVTLQDLESLKADLARSLEDFKKSMIKKALANDNQ